jgi:hypothetical protein
LGLEYEPRQEKLNQEYLEYLKGMDEEIQRAIHRAAPGGFRDIPPALKAVYAARDRAAEETPVLDRGSSTIPELPRLTGTLITSTLRIASLQLPGGTIAQVSEGDMVAEHIVKRIYQRHAVLQFAGNDITLEVSTSNVMANVSRSQPDNSDSAAINSRISANIQMVLQRIRLSPERQKGHLRRLDARPQNERYTVLTVGLKN